MPERPWWLYLLECRGGRIYTGIAIDVDARFQKHASGKGAAFTRAHPPERILAWRMYPSRRLAAQAECAVKKLSAAEKRRWIAVTVGGCSC